jgi:hypothetical protein
MACEYVGVIGETGDRFASVAVCCKHGSVSLNFIKAGNLLTR